MAQVDMIMPKMGESVAEATIIKWLKKEGDRIEQDEPVLEIATDKVDSEVPSPTAGFLVSRNFNEGDVVQVGKVIAVISTEKEQGATKEPSPATSAPAEKKEAAVSVSASSAPATSITTERSSSSGKFYSPLVRNIAKQEAISMEELETISGSGLHGRVTKHDLLNYLPKRGQSAPATAAVSQSSSQSNSAPAQAVAASSNGHSNPAVSIMAGDEIIEMDRMRKLISDHMVMSKHTSPHVTSFVEVDVTNLVLWREKIKKEFEKREKEKITFTPVFIEAVVKAIKDYPMINVSVDGQRIIKRNNINIGMAAALPSGNLIVPVIKNADQKNLLGLTKSVNDLATRARGNKLVPEEIQGGTFTLTNVGSFGNIMGTPIINQPQVAILATGAIKKRPAVIETPQGDMIGIRHMMFLSLSYDHRVVDGALGGSFLRKVADYLEAFEINRSI